MFQFHQTGFLLAMFQCKEVQAFCSIKHIYSDFQTKCDENFCSNYIHFESPAKEYACHK